MKVDFHSVKWLLTGIVVGIFVAICISPLFRADRELIEASSDTTRTEVTKHYGKLELQTKKVKLEIPKYSSTPQVVFVPEEKVTTIVRDSVSYVMLDREFFYTETDDAQIWHSGIDSTIDSLVIKSWNEKITTVLREKDYHNTLSFYGAIGYNSHDLLLPIGVEYLYHPKKWIGFGGKVEYDAYMKNVSVLATTRITLRW